MTYRGNTLYFCMALVAATFAVAGQAFGQTAADHAKHHPAPGGGSPAPTSQAAPAGMPMSGKDNPAGTATADTGGNQPGTPPGGMNPEPVPGGMGGNPPGGAGMGAQMGDMMKQMGTPPPKELYPSLMALPDEVTPEQRAGIEQLAHERMKAGSALLSSGLEKLSESASGDDYAAVQQATAQMREGLAEFEAGVAARRLLAEGKAPRNLALGWYKREMNLASPVRPNEPRRLTGVTLLHLLTMGLLIAFALAMVAMYFFKMRRAAALFGRLAPDTNPPPPGAAPPLAGAPWRSAPAALSDKKAPPARGTPLPTAAPPSPPPAEPAAEKSSAPASPGTPAAAATPPAESSTVPVPGGDAANAG